MHFPIRDTTSIKNIITWKLLLKHKFYYGRSLFLMICAKFDRRSVFYSCNYAFSNHNHFFFLKTLIKWKHLPIYLLFIIIKIDVCVYVSVFLCVCVLFYVCYCPPNPGWCNSRFVWKKPTSEAGANIIIKTDFFVCVCMMFSEEKGCSQRYTIWKEDTCISEIMHIEASFGFFD